MATTPSERKKKVRYTSGTKGKGRHTHESGFDSGVGSSATSERISVQSSHQQSPFDPQEIRYQRHNPNALAEALDAANETIRQLQQANEHLKNIVRDSNREKRHLKEEQEDAIRELETLGSELADEKRAHEKVLREMNRERQPFDITRPPSLLLSSQRAERRSIVPEAPTGPVPDPFIPLHERVSFDRSFRVIGDATRFFRVGRIFKIYWPEPVAADRRNSVSSASSAESHFVKLRRFVVIKEHAKHTLCLALSTFGGRGITKPGLDVDAFAAVYDENSSPQYRPGEKAKMQKDAFPVIIEDPRESIDAMTRLNFSKVYTVEHNVKVANVGRIPDSYLAKLRQYFATTLADPISSTPSELVSTTPLSSQEREMLQYGLEDEQRRINPQPTSVTAMNVPYPPQYRAAPLPMDWSRRPYFSEGPEVTIGSFSSAPRLYGSPNDDGYRSYPI